MKSLNALEIAIRNVIVAHAACSSLSKELLDKQAELEMIEKMALDMAQMVKALEEQAQFARDEVARAKARLQEADAARQQSDHSFSVLYSKLNAEKPCAYCSMTDKRPAEVELGGCGHCFSCGPCFMNFSRFFDGPIPCRECKRPSTEAHINGVCIWAAHNAM